MIKYRHHSLKCFLAYSNAKILVCLKGTTGKNLYRKRAVGLKSLETSDLRNEETIDKTMSFYSVFLIN